MCVWMEGGVLLLVDCGVSACVGSEVAQRQPGTREGAPAVGCARVRGRVNGARACPSLSPPLFSSHSLPLTFCANRSAADVFSPVVMTAVTTGRDWAALLYQRPTAVKGAAMRDATDDMTREFALCRSGVRPGSFSLTQAATCRGQAC